MSSAKNILRQRLLAQRNALSDSEKQQANQRINEYLSGYLSTCQTAVIGAYLAFAGEPDIAPSLLQLNQHGHTIAVPRIGPQPGRMQFYRWHPDSRLTDNRFGIAEPEHPTDNNTQTSLPVSAFAILLIPLVGFDADGHRLGMGGGYYDRWLADADDAIPERIGIAHHWQQQARIPFDTMDQPLHRVITDRGIIEL